MYSPLLRTLGLAWLIAACGCASAAATDGRLDSPATGQPPNRDGADQSAPSATEPSRAVDRRAAPGMYDRTITLDGRERVFRVYVPEGYDPSQPAPLFVFLHGGKHSAQTSSNMKDVRRAADRHGFIAAYGQGALPAGKGYHWHGVNIPGERHVDEVAYISAMLDEIEGSLAVDRRHIGAVGFSNGGMMAHRLGGELSERLAVVISSSSYVGGHRAMEDGAPDIQFGPPAPQRPISVMMVNNRRDPKVAYEGGGDGPLYRKSTAEGIAFWVAANRCQAQPEVRQIRGAQQDRYDCPDGGNVILYSFDRASHRGPRMIDGQSRATVWYEFLMSHPRT